MTAFQTKCVICFYSAILEEICKSLEPCPVHGENYGMCFGCVRGHKLPCSKFEDLVTYYSSLKKMLVSQPRRGLFEFCKSLESCPGHGELNGMGFGRVRAGVLPRSAFF